jgi:hypothetical protein
MARLTVQDFVADVANRTDPAGLIVYVATLNADGSIKITNNGGILYPKVYWAMGRQSARTDANPNADSVTILNADGTVSCGDAQQFINSLVMAPPVPVPEGAF